MKRMSKWKKYLPGTVLAVTLCYLLFIYGPLELYVNNQEDLSYDLYDLMAVMIPAFLCSAAIGSGILFVLQKKSKKAYLILLAISFCALLSFYIQGAFLSQNLPALDGRAVHWSEYDYQRIYSVVELILVIGLTVFLFSKIQSEKIETIIASVGSVMLAFLVLSSALSCLTDGAIRRKTSQSATNGHLMDYSEEENVVFLLLDAVDATAFQTVMEKHPEYIETLSDFTFFPDALAGYPYTSRSVPFILSGEWYENKESFTAYCEHVFLQSPMLSALRAKDYEMNFYCADYAFVDELPDVFLNIRSTEEKVDAVPFLKTQIKLALYRYVPYDVKKMISVTAEEIMKNTSSYDGQDLYSSDLAELQEIMEHSEIRKTEKKQFKFFYTEGAHLPFSYQAQSPAFKDYSYESSIEKSMEVVYTFLSGIKQAGIYDRSILLILADHGYASENESYGRQNPMLLVKGLNEHHTFVQSSQPVSYAEIAEAVQKMLSGCPCDEAFLSETKGNTERRFLFYDYDGEEYLTEYIQIGYAADLNSMTPTGNRYIRRDFQWFVDGVNNRFGN